MAILVIADIISILNAVSLSDNIPTIQMSYFIVSFIILNTSWIFSWFIFSKENQDPFFASNNQEKLGNSSKAPRANKNQINREDKNKDINDIEECQSDIPVYHRQVDERPIDNEAIGDINYIFYNVQLLYN